MTNDPPLYVSPRSRKGICFFFIICLIIIFLPRIVRSFDKPLSINLSKTAIETFNEKRNWHKKKEYQKKSRPAYKKKVFLAPERRFDPNQYQKNDWIKLGLSEKQVAVVLKFTEKGLYSNDDLEKIFVIPSTLFNLIKDSTYYPIAPTKKQEFTEKKLLVTHEIELNINTASENDLLSIKGLGPYFAKAILKYKAELGGFVRKSQLMEIFKMSNESYDKIAPYLTINPSDVRTININEATVEELNAHPYLNWGQANSIVKMRMQKVGFKDINEIKQSHLIDEETYEKLIPYLSI